jgi:hypothetical protein
MPITISFDFDQASIHDANDRARLNACLARLRWEHIGGSSWRYPAYGAHGPEDWFNHVIPALMYFRALVEHAQIRITRFGIDAQSVTGYRADPPYGETIQDADHIAMTDTGEVMLSEQRLHDFIRAAAEGLG